MTGIFVDSNVLIYAFTDDPKRIAAEDLLFAGPTIAVQSLNKFCAVALRKFKRSWTEIDAALEIITQFCSVPLPLTLPIHRIGVALVRRHRFKIYDAMLVAAALDAGCDIFYSEDLHNGLVIDRRLRIINPFAPTADTHPPR